MICSFACLVYCRVLDNAIHKKLASSGLIKKKPLGENTIFSSAHIGRHTIIDMKVSIGTLQPTWVLTTSDPSCFTDLSWNSLCKSSLMS